MTYRAWNTKTVDRAALKELTAAIAQQNTEELEYQNMDEEWSEEKYRSVLAVQQKEAGLLAGILAARGITDPAEALTLLAGEEELSDPMLLTDMDKACERILRAIDEGETIVVFGDYDVDGVTATALLYQHLKGMGAAVKCMLPSREGDGYGLSKNAIQSIYDKGCRLIVTVDNGISAVEEAAFAASLGIDLIITDHHLPHDTLPQAVAIVDPRRADDHSPFKGLCGAGVAFKLCAALDGCPPEEMLEYCGDLAAVGTVAGATHSGCFLQFDLMRASMPGAVLRSLLPTAVTLVLAWGLYRGRRFAATCAVAINLFTAGVAIAYYLVVPLSFAPDGMTSLLQHGAITACVTNTLPPLIFAIALAAAMKHFPIRVGWRRLIGGVGAIVLVLLACAAVYLMYGIAQPDAFSPRATASSLLAELPGRFLPIGFLSHMKLSFVPRTPMASIVYQGVGLVFWIAVLVVVIRWMSDVSESNERAQARAERLVETGGESMSFMTTWEGNSYWLSPTGKSAVAYRVLNGIALTCTGPFGELSEWMDDLTGFTQYCVERSLSPVFYSVHREQRDALLEAGWSSIEVGSEMVVDPRGWKTTGKKWQDVRTAINKAKRDGVTDVQSTFLEASLDVREQIEDISEEWAQLKALPEMKFTLGGVEELRDPRVRLLYAIDADGRVLGVTSWLPTWRDGRIVGWTLDFMRHRTDSPNGIMEFLIARMAERLRDEGLADPEHAVEFMSLSAAPLAGMNPERDNAREGGVAAGEGTQVLQHALQIVADWMEPAYGFHSLFNFKRKFQPAEAPVYVCYPDPAALPQIGLAVVRAYVPSVTPAEVAGMLSTLRS